MQEINIQQYKYIVKHDDNLLSALVYYFAYCVHNQSVHKYFAINESSFVLHIICVLFVAYMSDCIIYELVFYIFYSLQRVSAALVRLN